MVLPGSLGRYVDRYVGGCIGMFALCGRSGPDHRKAIETGSRHEVESAENVDV